MCQHGDGWYWCTSVPFSLPREQEGTFWRDGKELKSLFHFGKLLYLGLAKLEAMGLKVGCNLSTPPGLKEPELDPG